MASYRQLTNRDLRSAASESTHPGIREYLSEIAEDGLEDYDGQFLAHDGDLHIDGSFDTDDLNLTFWLIIGDLIVDGLFESRCNDGPSMVIVRGNLRARNVLTAGFLEVGGDLCAQEAIVGEYNDGGALVQGALQAQVFLPFDHGFDIRGTNHAQETLQGLQCRPPPTRLARRFFRVDDGGRCARLFAGEADDSSMYSELRAGRSILEP